MVAWNYDPIAEARLKEWQPMKPIAPSREPAYIQRAIDAAAHAWHRYDYMTDHMMTRLEPVMGLDPYKWERARQRWLRLADTLRQRRENWANPEWQRRRQEREMGVGG